MNIPHIVLNLYAICITVAILCVIIVNKRTEKNAFIAKIKKVSVFDISVIINRNISTQTFYLALIDLSNRGYINIETDEQDGLILTKLKELPENDESYADIIFGKNKQVKLLDIPPEYFKTIRKSCFSKAQYYSDMWFKSSPLQIKILTPFIVLLPIMALFMLEIIKQSGTKQITGFTYFLSILMFIADGILMTSSLASPVSAFFEEKIQNTKFQTICRTGVLVVTLISVAGIFRESMVFAMIVDLGYLMTLKLISEMQAYNYLGLSYEAYCRKLPKEKNFDKYFLECYCTGKMEQVETKFKNRSISAQHGFHPKPKENGLNAYETYFFNILDLMEGAEKRATRQKK